MLEDKITQLISHKDLLNLGNIGLEREGLRVAKEGGIANTAHPKAFGSALTHPFITTDFSESLLEIVTPTGRPDAVLKHLSDTQHFVYQQLENEEIFWANSMPCVIRGKTSIPLAQYGNSNIGRLKTLYRNGLGLRYGTTMQVIAGIHFNYSYHTKFWKVYQAQQHNTQPLQLFIDEQYMRLVRNLLRFNWLIVYLFGASPSVCQSFLKNYHQHNLIPLTTGSLYEPFATSLRMGDIGYQNFQEYKSGVKANYNSLSNYINSLKSAMQTPSEAYQQFSSLKNGQHQQINANLLQIENEYYSSVRPKPPIGDDRPTTALKKNGIAYVELRSLDINPMLPLGIDKDQILFLETLFLVCLLLPSPAISSPEQVEIDNNTNMTAHDGINPNLILTNQGQRTNVKQWGTQLIKQLKQCALLLSVHHQSVIDSMEKRLHNSKLTPSQTLVNKMRETNSSFFEVTKNLSLKHQQYFKQQPVNQQHFEQLKQLSKQSIEKAKTIKQSDTLNFDQFLEQFNQ